MNDDSQTNNRNDEEFDFDPALIQAVRSRTLPDTSPPLRVCLRDHAAKSLRPLRPRWRREWAYGIAGLTVASVLVVLSVNWMFVMPYDQAARKELRHPVLIADATPYAQASGVSEAFPTLEEADAMLKELAQDLARLKSVPTVSQSASETPPPSNRMSALLDQARKLRQTTVSDLSDREA